MPKILNISSTYSQFIQPNTQILFSNLSQADFSNQDLSDCVFFACIIDACNFQNTVLNNCVFKYCYITDSTQKPLFDDTISMAATFEMCNFLPENNCSIYAIDTVMEKINRILHYINSPFSVKILDEIRATVKLDNPSTDIREIFAFTHLFYADELIIRNAYFFYLNLFKKEQVKNLLGVYYDDVLTYFLSFCIKGLISPDYVNLFEDIYFNNKAPFTIENNIVEQLVNKIHLNSAKEQLKGIRYAAKFLNYNNAYANCYDIDRIASFLLSKNIDLAKESKGVIMTIMGVLNFEEKHPIQFTIKEFQSHLNPYIEQTITSNSPLTQIIGLEIIQKGDYWDWDKQNQVLDLLNSKNEQVNKLANKVVDIYEYIGLH